jgi:hypothetical protein
MPRIDDETRIVADQIELRVGLYGLYMTIYCILYPGRNFGVQSPFSKVFSANLENNKSHDTCQAQIELIKSVKCQV